MLNGCAVGIMKVLVVTILLTSIIWLCGCKTKEYVYIEHTDTLLIHHNDTVKETQIKWQKKDSIVHDSVIVKQDSSGKPIEIHHWHTEKVTDIQRDSVDKYKAKCDSLIQKIKNTKKEKEIVAKTNYGGWVAFSILLLAALAALYIFLRKRK